jgi:predicted metal-binding membrane protein
MQESKTIGVNALESALRRDRLLVVCALLFVIVLSWAYLLTGAGTMQEMGGMLMPMSAAEWTPGHALLMLVMWIVMMAAMMLPSAAPMILLYATIVRKRHAGGARVATPGIFALGYLAVWALFSVLAVVLQFGLEKAALLSPMMETTSVMLAGAVLIAAGIYQWLPLKQACLRHCRSPLEFVLMRWREGAGGAFKMGVEHGVYCVGCCWVMMLLLFVGGVMNLAWIAGLAFFFLLEKWTPTGHWLARAAGVLLIGWGAAVLFAVPLSTG